MSLHAASPPSPAAPVTGGVRQQPTPAPAARLRSKRLALAAILLVGLAYATMIQSFSWNQTSHYDLIRSLDNDGTTIDAYQVNTGDKVLYRGQWYSARAPGLALFALPFYHALNVVGADSWARSSPAQRGDDEMVYFTGL